MKKAFFTLAIAALALGLSSCKGDYDCACTYDMGSSNDTTLTSTFLNVSKGDAEEACDAAETSYQVVDPNASCTLTKN